VIKTVRYIAHKGLKYVATSLTRWVLTAPNASKCVCSRISFWSVGTPPWTRYGSLECSPDLLARFGKGKDWRRERKGREEWKVKSLPNTNSVYGLVLAWRPRWLTGSTTGSTANIHFEQKAQTR